MLYVDGVEHGVSMYIILEMQQYGSILYCILPLSVCMCIYVCVCACAGARARMRACE